MYYYYGYLKQTDWHVWDKLLFLYDFSIKNRLKNLFQRPFNIIFSIIKRDVLYKAIDSISDYYLNSHMNVNEDGLIDYLVLKTAK